MEKRNNLGQVTIFIILAVLIVASVALFFTLRGTLQEDQEAVSSEVAPIQNYVQECLEDVSLEVISVVAARGGYYSLVEGKYYENWGFSYYKIGDKNYVPSKKFIENEIAENVKRNLINCTGNFSEFLEYEVKSKKISSSVTIEQDEIFIDVKYPLLIKRGESISEIEDFEFRKVTPFGRLYEASKEYVESELSLSTSAICISCLGNVSEEYLIEPVSYNLGEDYFAFIFMDKEDYKNNYEEGIKYVFVNKY